MKRIALTLVLLLGGTTVAHANPPGLSPTPADAAGEVPAAGPWARGPMAERGPMAQRGPRGGRGPMAQRGSRAGKHRLPPQLRARLVAMFDRDGDGRLQGPERRAARRFVRKVVARRLAHRGAGQGLAPGQAPRGPRGPRGPQGFGPGGGGY